VKKRIVYSMSSIWVACSGSEFERRAKWAKSYAFLMIFYFHFLRNFISRCCPSSGFMTV
jgi:hypothetical protein